MIGLVDPHGGSPLCDGIDRRAWLRMSSSIPVLGLGSKASAAVSTPKARSVIYMFHLGGPAQHETWDPKPDAPSEIRGSFKPIPTTTPGYYVGELMPRTARMMRHIAVLRALSTRDNAHSSSGYWMLTGVPHLPSNTENAKLGAPNDWPSLAAINGALRGKAIGMPASMVLPEHIWNTGGIPWPGQDAGFLGRTSDPWLLHCMPQEAGFAVPGVTLPGEVAAPRLADRVNLSRNLDACERQLQQLAEGPAVYRKQVETALQLVQSGAARRAFRLEEEQEALRDRYGRNRWGQSVLLARRLVEAGVSFIQLNWTRMPGDTNDSPAWDTHNKNADRLKNHLMPIMDAAYSTLLEDLAERGLLDSTLVVWGGEFGRTPHHNGGGGRDHWGHVFSGALAGGGIKGGVVHGSSDKLGAQPREGRVEPQDLHATILHLAGLNPESELHDAQNRPFPASRGNILEPIIA